MDLLRMILIGLIIVLAMSSCEQIEGSAKTPVENAESDATNPENPNNFVEDEETGELVEREFSIRLYIDCVACDVRVMQPDGSTPLTQVSDYDGVYAEITGYKLSEIENLCMEVHVSHGYANQGAYFEFELYTDEFIEPAVRILDSNNGGTRCLELTSDLSYYEMFEAVIK